MDGKGIKVRFEADESPVRSALTRVEKSVKAIAKDLKEVDKLLELDPDNIKLLETKQDQLASAVERTTKNLKAMSDANEDMTKGYQKWQQNQQAIEDNAKAIKEMSAQLDAAKSAMKAMQDAGGADIKFTEEYANAVSTVESLTKALSKLEKEQEQLKMADPNAIPVDVYQRYIRDTESLRINLKQLEQQQTEVASAIQAGGMAAQKAAAEEQERLRIEQQSKAVEEEKAQAAAEAARIAEEQAKAEEERKRATERAAEADRQAKKASEDYKGALDRLKTAANNVKNDIKTMFTVVTTGIAAIGSAVATGTAAATKVGMEFTKSMSNVKALSGATTSELEALRDAASDAGANTSKTASEAADALGMMALAGWDTTQMLDGLMPILRASEAGAMDLATCSDLVTDSMSAMGIAVSDLQHYLDVCAKTQSNANTSMEELLQAYVTCGGTLKNLNVPLEESAALLGTLANRGIKGSEAGTALNSILINLIGANKNASSAMKEMGLSAFDAEGHFIGLEETLKLVRDKLAEYGDDTEKITQLEAKLGGKTQLDTLQALLSGVSEEYDSLNSKIIDCNGALETTAQVMQDNLSGDLTTLQSALEGVENTIFNSLEEPFRNAAQNVTQELRDLNAACSDGELAEAISKIANAVSNFISEAAAFVADEAFPTLIKWLEWIADHSDLVIAAIKGMGAAWGAWKIGQYASHLQELVKAIQLVQSASAASTAAQTALAASGTAAAASEDALAVSGAAATASQEALAAATKMATSAQLLLIAALGAVAIALASYVAKGFDEAAEMMDKATFSAKSLSDKIQDETDVLRENREALEDLKKSQEEKIAADEAEINNIERLWKELQTYVDENGNVISNNERANEIIELLNRNYDMNIGYIDGQIQGYQNLAGSMDDYLAKLRLESRIRNGQGAYDEAVAQYDDLIKKRDELMAQEESARQLWEKQAKAGDVEAANLTGNARAALQKQIAEVEADIANCEDIMGEFEGLYASSIETAAENAADSASGAADDLGDALEDTTEVLKEAWEQAEHDYAIGTIKTEEELYDKLNKIWNEYGDSSNKDHWRYYENLKKHDKDYAENLKKQTEQEIKGSIEEQIAAVKERQELENEYTKEMMYNDMEEIISGLDKESELYKKYNSEILKGRKALADEGAKTIADGLKADVTSVENSIKTVVSDYQNSLKNLLSQRDTYFNKLFDTSSFAARSKQTDENGNEADVLTLADPKEAFNKLLEYEKAYEELKAKNVSENVLNWIDSLDQATAQDTMDILNHMSADQLKSYSSSFDQYKAQAEKMADSKYAKQIEDLNTGFVQKVDDLLATLPGKAEVDGENTVAGFIQGLESKGNDLSAAASDFANKFIDQVKKDLDINSPSGEGEDLGEYTGEGFIKGVDKSADDIGDAVNNFTNAFITKLAEKDPEIRAAMEDVFTGNLTAVLTNMETLADASLNRIATALSGKLPELPDVTQLSLPSIEAVSNASGSSTSDMTNLTDNMNSLIAVVQELASKVDNLTINLQLAIDGELVADTDRIVALIAKKFNNLSIQTGKQVFSY